MASVQLQERTFYHVMRDVFAVYPYRRSCGTDCVHHNADKFVDGIRLAWILLDEEFVIRVVPDYLGISGALLFYPGDIFHPVSPARLIDRIDYIRIIFFKIIIFRFVRRLGVTWSAIWAYHVLPFRRFLFRPFGVPCFAVLAFLVPPFWRFLLRPFGGTME